MIDQQQNHWVQINLHELMYLCIKMLPLIVLC